MVKGIIKGIAEELGEIPKQVAGQTVKLPTEVAKGMVEVVVKGGKRIDPLTGLEIPSPQKVRQLKKQEAKRKAAGISRAQQIISGAQKPRPAVPAKPAELPAYLGGKPGMTEERLAQMQGLKPTKRELPPPISAAKPKFGTGERKLGISG